MKILLKLCIIWYIHSYLNDANIAWASTYATKFKIVYLKQKHAVRLLFKKLEENKITRAMPTSEKLNTLNVDQINIY